MMCKDLRLKLEMLMWITMMTFNKIDSAQTNDVNQPNPLVTADVGGSVTLHCFRLKEETGGAIVWYKQKFGHEPRVMVTVQQEASFEDEFKSPRFSIEKEKGSCHLKMANVEPSDEAMYYCGFRHFLTTFGKGTFLSVKGKPAISVSVSQSGVSDSVPAGASVTLQCSVLSESRAAELQVLWFRAAPPQSHPQIIYTHHNSSHQCESGSPTHTCVYNFSKNILSHSDTGTYYCAVAVCGKIIFGNGTRVQLDSAQSVDFDEAVSLVSADFGHTVTLQCTLSERSNSDLILWYKQKLGGIPQAIGMTGLLIAEIILPPFNKSTYKHPLDISVFQSGVSDSVPAGASVTLQCSVLSESRAAELQVLWFRAAPPQSHPQIIYTHHNSGHQCESGSSTHTCVYNFSKNILGHNDTGTYYCAVAACGKIIFGNGTRVELERQIIVREKAPDQ
ncbi:signal-regulatory protein beta-1-like, partial [Clarias magur]